jgi:hypothetical protein
MWQIVKFLQAYPLHKDPPPESWPEILKHDEYPGEDFVVGFCDDAVEMFARTSGEAKLPEMKQLALDYVELFQSIRADRILLLSKV